MMERFQSWRAPNRRSTAQILAVRIRRCNVSRADRRWRRFVQFRRTIPSLTALVALEAVVRHRSVTAAAKELGVTQAAVSRQVAILEAEFGFPLFRRGHRSIEPTGPCVALAASLASGLAAIAEGVDALRASASREIVTIGATLAFSNFWLLPRLAQFRRLHPGIQIRVISQDTRLNLDAGEVDIAIRYGLPPFADGSVLASREDTIVPVCSPDYAAQLAAPEFWRGAYDLIETDVPDRSWLTWPGWFASACPKVPAASPSLRFSHHTEAISAARAGQGLALGWGILVRDFLAEGSLVRVGERQVPAEGRHNIVVPNRPRRNGLCDVAAGWMVEALGA
jgi:LysR family transcriptional regulator, glycine cleavage system transcriptional activator